MGEDKVTGLSGTTYSTADGEQSVIPNPITTAKKVENKGMNDDALKMVKSYGDAFPMVQEPNAMQNPAMQPPVNRAAAAPERGNLTNNVLPDQDAAKVSAASMGRDMKFNDIASSQGKAYPQPVPTTAVQTPQAQTFPKAGGMAAYGDTAKEGEVASGYANPKSIDNSAKQEVLAGAGDELQGIKRGIMEMADAIVINKADGENKKAAKLAKTEFNRALHLYPPKASGWTPKTMTCSALENEGIDDVHTLIRDYLKEEKASGYFQKKRDEQHKFWLLQTIESTLKSDFFTRPEVKEALKLQLQKIENHETTAFEAADVILNLR